MEGIRSSGDAAESDCPTIRLRSRRSVALQRDRRTSALAAYALPAASARPGGVLEERQPHPRIATVAAGQFPPAAAVASGVSAFPDARTRLAAGPAAPRRGSSAMAVSVVRGSPGNSRSRTMQRVLPDPTVRIAGRERDIVPSRLRQSDKRPQDMEPGQRLIAPIPASAEAGTIEVSCRSWSSRWAVSRRQLFRLASSATRAAESKSPEPRRRSSLVAGRISRHRRPRSFSGGQVHLGPDVIGDRPGVFDIEPVHVDDMQRPVRRVDEGDRPEPVVGRRQELRFGLGPDRPERDAVGNQPLAVDDVRRHIGDEDIAVEIRGVLVAAIDRERRSTT